MIGAITVVFAEIVPKRLALIKPESIASALARPMAWIATLASPLVMLLSGCADLVLLMFGRRRTQEDTVSEDELRMIVDQGMASGVLHASEHRMVHGALSLDLITAEQLMTPSSRVVWLNLNDPEEINWRKIVACKGSVMHPSRPLPRPRVAHFLWRFANSTTPLQDGLP